MTCSDLRYENLYKDIFKLSRYCVLFLELFLFPRTTIYKAPNTITRKINPETRYTMSASLNWQLHNCSCPFQKQIRGRPRQIGSFNHIVLTSSKQWTYCYNAGPLPLLGNDSYDTTVLMGVYLLLKIFYLCILFCRCCG